MVAGDGGYEVDAAALRRHVDDLRSTGRAVEQAHDAARTVVLGDSAYGILCRVLPMMFGGLGETVSDAVGLAARHYTEQADALASTVSAYERADERSDGSVRSAGSGLPGAAGAGR